MKEAGEEEGPAEVVDEFSDLVSANGDEAFVTAVLAVLLLEDDARHAPDASLLGGNVLARVRAGNSEDRLIVLGIRARKAVEIRERLRLRLRRVKDGSGRGLGEVAAVRGESSEDVAV